MTSKKPLSENNDEELAFRSGKTLAEVQWLQDGDNFHGGKDKWLLDEVIMDGVKVKKITNADGTVTRQQVD